MQSSVLAFLRQNKKPISDPALLGKLLATLSRPQNSLQPGLLTLVAYYATNKNPATLAVVALYVLVFALYSIASIVNYIQDLDADKINNRNDNPLIANYIPPKHMIGFVSIMATVIIFANIYLANGITTLITACYVFLLYSYSAQPLRLKSRGLQGTVCLALCYTSLPILLGTSHLGYISADIVWITLVISTASLATLLSKDYKDEKGDRATNTKTPLVLYGARKITIFTIIATVAVTSSVVLAVNTLNSSHLPLLLIIIYSLIAISLHVSRNRYIQIRTRLAKLMLLATAWTLLSASQLLPLT